MAEFFPNIPKVTYKPGAKEPFCYKHYDPKKKVLGKTMAEHLRIAICFWHTFCWQGSDPFGLDTMKRPWLTNSDPMKLAFDRVDAGFEFIEKLGVPFFAFHNVDVAPEGKNLKENNDNLSRVAEKIAEKMQKTGIELLWGTTNLTGHPRYMSGAATNPDPAVFAYAAAQVKHTLDVTHQLGGHNYVLWGGREGYETLLNTDLKKESDQMGRFLSMLADYKHKIGYKGALLIEPKPREPSKHQYDYDVSTVYAFLQHYGLEKEYKMNIEGNHATLAGHTFTHEVAYAYAMDIFGSIDINEGDLMLGWDTDQFPIDRAQMTHLLYIMLQNGGFTSGGFNFDAKVRRQSIDLEDLFHAHISGIDTMAQALVQAEKLLAESQLKDFVEKRYSGWDKGFGKEVLQGKSDLEKITEHALKEDLNPKPKSGRQEYLERILKEGC